MAGAFHQLTAFTQYRAYEETFSYGRLASGIEVDFVLGDMVVAIEAKSSATITRDHLEALRSLVIDFPDVRRRIVVCREPKPRKTDDHIEILPANVFAERLWHGDIVWEKAADRRGMTKSQYGRSRFVVATQLAVVGHRGSPGLLSDRA